MLSGVTRLGIVLVLSLIAALAIYPIVFMGLSSFRTSLEYLADPLGLPSGILLCRQLPGLVLPIQYAAALPEYGHLHPLASAITLGVAVPASFTFAKMRFPARDGLRAAMIATLIMPPVTFLVPSYVMMANLGLIDTSLPVVLLWSATSVPGSIFLLSALMRGIPSEILEAARLDGAGYLETLLRIALPLSLPGIVTVMIFNITTWWNDLLIPLVFIGGGREDDAHRRGGDDRRALQHGLPARPLRRSSSPPCRRSSPTSSCSATSGADWCSAR